MLTRVVARILDVSWYVSLVGGGASLVLLALQLVTGSVVSEPRVALPVFAEPVGDGAGLELRGTVALAEPSRGLLALVLVAVALGLAWALFVLAQLRGLLRALRTARPFDPANARRVRAIGLALIAWEFGDGAWAAVASRYAAQRVVIDGFDFTSRYELHSMPIVVGLAVVAIAEAFRTGTRLAEDEALTI